MGFDWKLQFTLKCHLNLNLLPPYPIWFKMPLNTCFQIHGFSNLFWSFFLAGESRRKCFDCIQQTQFSYTTTLLLQNVIPPNTNIHTPANLEASGNGGVLVVCSLRVSYQVVPAGEHLPAESEVSLLCSVPSFICITSHPKKWRPDRGYFKKTTTTTTTKQLCLQQLSYICEYCLTF